MLRDNAETEQGIGVTQQSVDVDLGEVVEKIMELTHADGPLGKLDLLDVMVIFAVGLVLGTRAAGDMPEPPPVELARQAGELISHATMMAAPTEGVQ